VLDCPGTQVLDRVPCPGRLTLFDARTGRVSAGPVDTPPVSHWNPTLLAVSPDGRAMATGHEGGVVQVRDARTLSLIAEPDSIVTEADGVWVIQVDFSPDDAMLVASTGVRTAVWSVRDPAAPRTLARRRTGVAVQFVPGGLLFTSTAINSEAIFGIIPSGTRNVLAKSLDLPQGIDECCHSYMKGITRKIDVLTATVTNPSDRSKVPTRAFLNAAEIGFGAEVIDRSKRSRIKNRMVSTITSVIATLPTYESNNCEIVFDDGQEKVVTKMTMGVIANGKFLGGGFMAAPEASFSDGLLDVVILRDSGSLKMLDKLANIKTGNYIDEVDVIYKQAMKVSIKSNERDITVAIDGEPIGILPATFQVNQYPLNLLS
jgi:diacylglycerol kinase (ATP)